MMLPSEFFKLYIPALEIALESDSQNLGYYVKGPEDYLDDSLLPSIDEFIESKSAYSPFLDMVGIYFDARSHYFTEIDGENINHFKGRIANCLEKYKKEFKIDN
jgi:hypothetical protein